MYNIAYMEDKELKNKIEEIHKLSKENQKILRVLRRRTSSSWKIVFFIVLIIFGIYLYNRFYNEDISITDALPEEKIEELKDDLVEGLKNEIIETIKNGDL